MKRIRNLIWLLLPMLLLAGCAPAPGAGDPFRAALDAFFSMLNADPRPLAHEDRDAFQSTPVLVIQANGRIFYAALEDNPAAQALIQALNAGPMDVTMAGYPEKTGPLPWRLPANEASISAAPGDVLLAQGNRIVICCGPITGEFTRLARIGNAGADQLPEALGQGDAAVRFYLEWSE